MGLFGKADNLSALIKRLQTDGTASEGEIEVILEQICSHAEFHLDKHLWMFSHPNAKVRQCVAKQLLSGKNSSLATPLLREMENKSLEIRRELARLIVLIAGDRVSVHLGSLVHSKKPAQRQIAVDLIAQHEKWQDFLGYLKVTLRDPEPTVRHPTVRLLTRDLENPTIFLILRALINSDDATTRRLVIEAFCTQPTPDIVEPFFERITHEDHGLRNRMINTLSGLARTSQSKVEEHLLPMLADDDPESRDTAVKLLGGMPDQTRVLRAFLLHCQGMAFWLRERSLHSIMRVNSNIVAPLVELMHDEELDVCVGAMMMAKGIDDPRIVPHIRDIFLGESDWWVRSMAADILGDFGGDEVTEALISRLGDEELRYSVISVLGRQVTPMALRALVSCLEDPQPGIRKSAITAIAGRKTPDVLKLLVAAAKNDPADAVRDRAVQLMQEFGNVGQRAVDEVRRQENEAAEEGGVEIQLEMANPALNK